MRLSLEMMPLDAELARFRLTLYQGASATLQCHYGRLYIQGLMRLLTEAKLEFLRDEKTSNKRQ